MNKSTVDIENLSFYYDALPTLEDVHLKIEGNEFVGIFGPNGGGKSTLLKLILGLLRPQTGKILLFGLPPSEARHLIGYVPQSVSFDKDFPISVLEVVMMGALSKLSWLGIYPAEVKKNAIDALEKVGLGAKAKACFGTLSGGEAQRALIARAIVDSPKMLILDEPTANIDPHGEQKIHELLIQLNKTMAILMVTHDLQTIVDKVGKLLCVQRKVSYVRASELCEHFALGLYHTPLTSKRHFFPQK